MDPDRFYAFRLRRILYSHDILFLGVDQVINSFGIIPKVVVDACSGLSRWCLVVAIAALGVKTSLQQLASLGWRPVLMLAAETVFLAGLILGGLLILR